MVGRRKRPDGLPERLYMREGKRVTSFFIKHADNRRQELGSARSGDMNAVREARRRAEQQYDEIMGVKPLDENTTWLIDKYFVWQASLPDSQRKAVSTITENKREAVNLKKFFGDMDPRTIEPEHCYAYIDERTTANQAAVKAGKEISLLSAVLEYGRRIGRVRDNVAKGIEKPRNGPSEVHVEWEQVEFLCEVGKAAGGSFAIMGLCAQFTWLTLRRPTETRNFTRDQIVTEGCHFTASKRKHGTANKTGTIQWSPLLRATVDEASAIKRWGKNSIPARYVFGNLAGEPYTKGGWKSGWSRLHDLAEAEAKKQEKPWYRFSLQDCRPGGVTEKEARGDTDTVDATLHADGRMVKTVYNRLRHRNAKPAL